MHESGIVRDLVRKICGIVKEQGATGVEKVNITLGAHAPITPDHFKSHFEIEVQGTVLESAQLVCNRSSDGVKGNTTGVTLNELTLILPD